MVDFVIEDYVVVISENFVATIYYHDEEVWQSRAFRIYDQAARTAREWIEKQIGEVKTGDITLDVDDLASDVKSFFGG